MANTSSTGGPLSPLPTPAPAPLEDNALLDFLHDWIAGITGIAGTLIRPRWQPEPGNIPDHTVTWLAFGITKREADTFAAELHNAGGLGYNELRRHEILEILVSFYGPSASSGAALLRDGMQVSQNLELLGLNNMGLVESGDLTTIPDLVKDRWMFRVDLPFRIKRQIVRNYGVQNLLTSNTSIDNAIYTTNVIN